MKEKSKIIDFNLEFTRQSINLFKTLNANINSFIIECRILYFFVVFLNEAN